MKRWVTAAWLVTAATAGVFELFPRDPEEERTLLAGGAPPEARATPARGPTGAAPPTSSTEHKFHARVRDALATPTPAGEARAPVEKLPVPDPVRFARVMEEAVREGVLADPRHASEETHPLSRFTPEQRKELHARLQRATNELAWYRERARVLQTRLAALAKEGGSPPLALEGLEVELLRTERAAAGNRAYVEMMAPKLAAARMPPPPPPQEGWVPPPSPPHSHEHEHAPGEVPPEPTDPGMEGHAP
ncbi:hypothetical protein JQX13_38245 [Archangium violaceum]|uniref:hypothetical protein n=1 Tax=Archangium violaceum TaxID=83451 RepID=UPI00193C0D78|nr:hypothetical protein [Archangium violaceum]QRK05934.1 hypothetical protein JQX13_38245 [Archangium violaceum]